MAAARAVLVAGDLADATQKEDWRTVADLANVLGIFAKSLATAGDELAAVGVRR